jgi:hypothetical protein
MSILHRGLSIDASYQVSVNLAKRFQRRRNLAKWFQRRRNLTISQSEARITCGGHVY